MKRFLFSFVTVLVLVPIVVFAVPPRTMSYQGILTDDVGVVVPDGNYDMTFRIYNVASAGTSLWTEIQTVSVASGRFNVILGSSVSLNALLFDVPYWLSLEVAGDPEMTPRTELAGSPYSLMSRTVENAAITAQKIANGAVISSKISNGTVVRSLNNLRDDIDLLAGANITITPIGNDLEISSSGATSDGDWTIIGNDQYSTVPGDVGIGTTTPDGKLDVETGTGIGGDFSSSGVDGNFTIRGRNDSGTTAAFYSNVAGTPYPGTPSALYTRGEDGARGAFLTSNGSGHGLVAQSNGTGHALWGWAFADGYAGYFSGGDGVLMEDHLQVGTDFEDGHIEVGTTSNTGQVDVLMGGALGAVVSVTGFGNGGLINVFDNTGGEAVQIAADLSIGAGGAITVNRDALATGIDLNGNWAGTNNPRITMSSTTSPMTFASDLTGNTSVQLPTDAISDAEILDEPGVGSATRTLALTLDGSVQTALSRSITVPSSGYVFVIGTCEVTCLHDALSYSRAEFGVANRNTSLMSNQDIEILYPPGLITGQYDTGITVQSTFEVASAGTHTFYFLAEEGFGDWELYDMQLSVMFFPTAYGTVSAPTKTEKTDDQAAAGTGLTDADIAAERAESEAFSAARIQRELDVMRQRIASLEQELAAERGE